MVGWVFPMFFADLNPRVPDKWTTDQIFYCGEFRTAQQHREGNANWSVHLQSQPINGYSFVAAGGPGRWVPGMGLACGQCENTRLATASQNIVRHRIYCLQVRGGPRSNTVDHKRSDGNGVPPISRSLPAFWLCQCDIDSNSGNPYRSTAPAVPRFMRESIATAERLYSCSGFVLIG